MNRNNIWIHIGIAVILVTLAAVIGQIDRWRSAAVTSREPLTAVVTFKLPLPVRT